MKEQGGDKSIDNEDNTTKLTPFDIGTLNGPPTQCQLEGIISA